MQRRLTANPPHLFEREQRDFEEIIGDDDLPF